MLELSPMKIQRLIEILKSMDRNNYDDGILYELEKYIHWYMQQPTKKK